MTETSSSLADHSTYNDTVSPVSKRQLDFETSTSIRGVGRRLAQPK